MLLEHTYTGVQISLQLWKLADGIVLKRQVVLGTDSTS